MTITQSKITSQGQVTIPAEIRKRLGLAPGSVIEWREKGGEIVITRATTFVSEQIHEALFSTPPGKRTLDELDRGKRDFVRGKYASR